jgi:hypothetical protein
MRMEEWKDGRLGWTAADGCRRRGMGKNCSVSLMRALPSLLTIMPVLVIRLVYLSAAGVNYTRYPP